MISDPYAILGISPSSSGDEVKRAYRRRARMLHPDRNPSPDAADRFRELQHAYERITSGDAQRETPRVTRHGDEPEPFSARSARWHATSAQGQDSDCRFGQPTASGDSVSRASVFMKQSVRPRGALLSLLFVVPMILSFFTLQLEARAGFLGLVGTVLVAVGLPFAVDKRLQITHVWVTSTAGVLSMAIAIGTWRLSYHWLAF